MSGYETICGGGQGNNPGWGWGSGGPGHIGWGGHGGWGQGGWGQGDDGKGGLNPSELSAAQNALAKLVGAALSDYLKDVSPSGGANISGGLHSLPNGLFGGLGSDTYAGGSSGSHVSFSRFAADSVGGGASTKAPTLESGTSFRLSTETVKVAGSTASGVKAVDPNVTMGTSHTVALSDKTTLTLTGVNSSALGKPGGH